MGTHPARPAITLSERLTAVPIDYHKRPTRSAPQSKSTTHGFNNASPIREVPIPRMDNLKALRYYIDMYNRLTAEISATNIANRDKMVKGVSSTSGLYRDRANAAHQMTIYGDAILAAHGL